MGGHKGTAHVDFRALLSVICYKKECYGKREDGEYLA
jgi:hypothetical protein